MFSFNTANAPVSNLEPLNLFVVCVCVCVCACVCVHAIFGLGLVSQSEKLLNG